MTKIPGLEEKLRGKDWVATRLRTREEITAGSSLADIAETVVAEADARYLAGDMDGCTQVLFHAVHDGVPIYDLYVAIKKIGGG
jgi:hypothetical protein